MIYKEISQNQWRKIFQEHLYDKHLVIDWDNYAVADDRSEPLCGRSQMQATARRFIYFETKLQLNRDIQEQMELGSYQVGECSTLTDQGHAALGARIDR
jgi:hypothetical protein